MSQGIGEADASCRQASIRAGIVRAGNGEFCQGCFSGAHVARELGVPLFFLENYLQPRSEAKSNGPTLHAQIEGPKSKRNWHICRVDLEAFVREHRETVQCHYRVLVDRRQREFEWLAGPGREGTAPDQRVADLLPEEVCVLDIETLGTNPDRHGIACIGTKKFVRSTGRKSPLDGPEYAPVGYQCFVPEGIPPLTASEPRIHTGPEALVTLAQTLNDVRGPIVGHNILDFDYRFLHGRIDLSAVVPKTVDTLHILWECSGRELRGLSLDALSGPSRGKPTKAATVPKMWRDGDHAAVIAYNENDCDLTMDLWWRLTTRKFFPVFGPLPGKELVSLREKDDEVMVGRRPQFTFNEWVSQVGSEKTCGICGRKVKQRLMYSRSPRQEPMCGSCVRNRRAYEKRLMDERLAGAAAAVRALMSNVR
jgi:hypothetical protein